MFLSYFGDFSSIGELPQFSHIGPHIKCNQFLFLAELNSLILSRFNFLQNPTFQISWSRSFLSSNPRYPPNCLVLCLTAVIRTCSFGKKDQWITFQGKVDGFSGTEGKMISLGFAPIKLAICSLLFSTASVIHRMDVIYWRHCQVSSKEWSNCFDHLWMARCCRIVSLGKSGNFIGLNSGYCSSF